MRLVLAALGCALLFAGCSKPEYIMPSVPLTQDMGAYQSANVEVVVPDGMLNGAGIQTSIKEGVAKQIRMQNVVTKTDVPEPDVLVKVTLVNVDRGNALTRATRGSSGAVGLVGMVSDDGEASVTVEVELTEVKKAARLASFTAIGTSAPSNDHSIQPQTSQMELSAAAPDLVSVSIDAACREIARYMKTRKVVAD
jgi:hypothetical protein